ncbi:helicase-related protein [bacterium]|nr:helicase-related protein [bacterium]
MNSIIKSLLRIIGEAKAVPKAVAKTKTMLNFFPALHMIPEIERGKSLKGGRVAHEPMPCLKNQRKILLRMHQLSAVRHALYNRASFIVFGTGQGKSLTAAFAAKCLHRAGKVRRVVVVTKLAILKQFKGEFDKIWADAPVVFTTANSFHRVAGEPEHTYLIVDEAHNFQNPKGALTRRLLKFASQCPRVMLLTATPFVNSFQDFAVPYALLTNQAVDVVKEWSAAEIQLRFRGLVAFHNPSKKSADFPTVHVQKHHLKLSKGYKKVKKDSFLVKSRMASITQNKLNWIVKHSKVWKQQGRKMIIYVEFIDSGVEKLRRLLTDNAINNAVITGDESKKKRDAVVAQYNTDPQTVKTRDASKRQLRALVRNAEKPVPEFRRDTLDKQSKKYRYTRLNSRKPVTQKDIDYINTLVIPPGWSPAYVMRKNPKVLWTAVGKGGKKQTRYSKDWNVQTEYFKFLQLADFDAPWEKRFLAETSNPKSQLAVASRLFLSCRFRPGQRRATTVDHFGLLSLQAQHVVFGTKHGARTARVAFKGKSGKHNQCDIQDAVVVEGLWRLTDGKQRTDNVFNLRKPRLGAYLKRFGIKPKQFRTLFACRTLVGDLMHKKATVYVTVGKRRKELLAVYRHVSHYLNNTPNVVKSNYVFRGLSALYEREPTIFFQIIKTAKTPARGLQLLIQHFKQNDVDWQHLLQSDATSNFTGSLDLLILSGAGGESIDLKRTQHTVFLSLPFTAKTYDQVVGRGARFKSHADLPAKDRKVNVHILLETETDRRLQDIIQHKKAKEHAAFQALIAAAS